jgi:DNA-binding response OmpR family regulator
LVLLDIVDSAGGLSPLTLLREKTVVPVIVIGSSAETIDKVLALELGADDYVAKPFECLEIAARIQAVLRRVSRAHPNRPLRVGPLTLNSARCEVSLHQDKLHLKPIEFRILAYLMRMTGYVVSRDNLVRHVYGRDVTGSDQRVAVHICHLRQKIETGDVFVKTIRGVGYQLCLKDKPSEE